MTIRQNIIPPVNDGYVTPAQSRANATRRDNDTVKTPKVTLYDIDYAILYHINNNLKLKIEQDEQMIDVPAIFADGERWAQIKSRGYLRDTSKKLMAPLIAIRRTSVDNDERIPILDLNNKTANFFYFPYQTLTNQYDRFGSQSNRKPSNEYYISKIPTYVKVSYDLIIWTHMIAQLNNIIQGIISVSNHMWGDFHTFRSNVSNVSMNVVNNIGDDRLVSATVPLTVDGYLLDEFEYQESEMDKAFTIKTVRFTNEREELDAYISEPYFSKLEQDHIHMENQQILKRNMKRNIRYR